MKNTINAKASYLNRVLSYVYPAVTSDSKQVDRVKPSTGGAEHTYACPKTCGSEMEWVMLPFRVPESIGPNETHLLGSGEDYSIFYVEVKENIGTLCLRVNGVRGLHPWLNVFRRNDRLFGETAVLGDCLGLLA